MPEPVVETRNRPGRPPATITYEPPPPPKRPWLEAFRQRAAAHLRIAAYIIAALWIFGGTAFFLLRFTLRFYQANQSAIEGLVKRLF